MNSCLGLNFLDICNDPFAFGNLVTIGDAIATLSIFLALTQTLSLVKKQKLSRSFKKLVLICSISFCMIILASLIQIIPGEAIPVVGYPLFWELLASSILSITIFYMIYRYHSKVKLTPNKPQHFIATLRNIISKGEEKDYAELASEIDLNSLKTVIEWANLYDKKKIRPNIENSDQVYNANMILSLLSDKQFCWTLVAKSPSLCSFFLEKIRNSNQFYLLKPFVWEIARQAILNKNSYLYREDGHTGLGVTKSFTNLLFSNYTINKNIVPLNYISLTYDQKLDEEQFEMFTKCYIKTIESFIISKDRLSILHHETSQIGKSIVSASKFELYDILKIDSPIEIYKTKPYKTYQKSSDFLEKIIKLIINNDVYKELDAEKISNKSLKECEKNICHKVIDWYLEVLKIASFNSKHDSTLRYPIYGIWETLFSHFEETSNNQTKVMRAYLKKSIFEQLDKSFKVPMHPFILRPLLSILGLTPSNSNEDSKNLHQEILDYVTANFLDFYKLSPKDAIASLPASYQFDEECLVISRGKTSLKLSS